MQNPRQNPGRKAIHKPILSIAIAAFLAFALSLSVTGQGGQDTDGDGVPDSSDNCIDYPNGPLAQDPSTPMCDAQEDGDMDGFGNPCDYDINQDGATGLDDCAETLALSTVVSVDPKADYNCDGAVGLDDYSASLRSAASVSVPGPSGLACAGTIPCP